MIGKKFCPRCGRKVDKLYEGLCLKCYVETHELLPKKIELKQCKVCGRYFVGNKSFEKIEAAVEALLEKYLKKFDLGEFYFRIVDNELIVSIENVKIQSKIVVHPFICNRCKRKSKTTVVVQIRGKQWIVEEILNEIKKLVFVSKDETLAITKEDKVRNGYDIYLSSKKAVRNIVKSIKNKYHIKTEVTRKLVSVKDSRKIYRDFVLIKGE